MFRVSLTVCAAALLALATCGQAQEGVDFSRKVYDSCGVPYSLAPWIISVRTEGVPFYDPPRPIPKPTKGGQGEFGQPTWNGLIGGVDGIPNDGTAPRGTLLISKALLPGHEGYALQLSQGPEGLNQPPAQEQQVRRFVVPFGVPYGQPSLGGCPNGLCPIR